MSSKDDPPLSPSLLAAPPASQPEEEEKEEEGKEEKEGALWEAPTASTKLLATVDEVIQEIGFGRFQLLISLFCFGCWFCLALDITVAAVFIPTVQCEWELSDNEVAVIPLVFYIGGLFNNGLMTFIGDRMGRKKFILIMLLEAVVFSVLGGIPVSDQKAIGYPWLLACRFVLGLAYFLGLNWTALYLCEFLPKKVRGAATFVLQIFFGLGSSLSALEGLLLIETVGWQWYSTIAVVTPALVLLALLVFIPETPRYLFVHGKQKEAQALLIKMAKFNRKDIVNRISLCADLELKDDYKVAGEEDKVTLRQKLLKLLREFSSIFNKDLRRATLLIGYIWFTVAFVYHAGIWLPTALLQDEGSICGNGNDSSLQNYTVDELCVNITLNMSSSVSPMNQTICSNSFISHNSTDNSSNHTEDSSCASVTDDDFYFKIAWTAFADVPGVIVSAILIEVIGRKLNTAFTTFGGAVSMLPLFYCGLAKVLDGYVVTALLFLFRGFQIGAYITLYVYVSEVYPTRLRGTVFGLFGVGRSIGQLLSPLSALSLVNYNYYACIGLYAGLSLIASVAALFLPFETKGKSLKD